MLSFVQDRTPVHAAPPDLYAKMDTELNAEFERLYPAADREVDIHAKQLEVHHNLHLFPYSEYFWTLAFWPSI